MTNSRTFTFLLALAVCTMMSGLIATQTTAVFGQGESAQGGNQTGNETGNQSAGASSSTPPSTSGQQSGTPDY